MFLRNPNFWLDSTSSSTLTNESQIKSRIIGALDWPRAWDWECFALTYLHLYTLSWSPDKVDVTAEIHTENVCLCLDPDYSINQLRSEILTEKPIPSWDGFSTTEKIYELEEH